MEQTKATKAPKRIWLQDGCDDEDGCINCEHLYGYEGVTWCGDPIHDNDTEYVRADLLAAAEAERDEALLRQEKLERALYRDMVGEDAPEGEPITDSWWALVDRLKAAETERARAALRTPEPAEREQAVRQRITEEVWRYGLAVGRAATPDEAHRHAVAAIDALERIATPQPSAEREGEREKERLSAIGRIASEAYWDPNRKIGKVLEDIAALAYGFGTHLLAALRTPEPTERCDHLGFGSLPCELQRGHDGDHGFTLATPEPAEPCAPPICRGDGWHRHESYGKRPCPFYPATPQPSAEREHYEDGCDCEQIHVERGTMRKIKDALTRTGYPMAGPWTAALLHLAERATTPQPSALSGSLTEEGAAAHTRLVDRLYSAPTAEREQEMRDADMAIRQWLDFGNQVMGTAHQGYFASGGWAYEALKRHHDRILAEREK